MKINVLSPSYWKLFIKIFNLVFYDEKSCCCKEFSSQITLYYIKRLQDIFMIKTLNPQRNFAFNVTSRAENILSFSSRNKMICFTITFASFSACSPFSCLNVHGAYNGPSQLRCLFLVWTFFSTKLVIIKHRGFPRKALVM